MEEVFKTVKEQGHLPEEMTSEDESLFDSWYYQEQKRLAHEKWKRETQSYSCEPWG